MGVSVIKFRDELCPVLKENDTTAGLLQACDGVHKAISPAGSVLTGNPAHWPAPRGVSFAFVLSAIVG